MQKCLLSLVPSTWWLQKQASAPSYQGHSLLVALCVSDLPVHSSLLLTARLTPAWGHYPWVPSGRVPRASPFPVGTVPLAAS